jgi:hypothetical protein
MRKQFFWRLLQVLLFLITVYFLYNNLYRLFPQADINAEVRNDKLSGIVVFIDQGRGFRMELNNSKRYELSASNDVTSLSNCINFGDSVFKEANSDTLFLKSKSSGKIIKFWLYDTSKEL